MSDDGATAIAFNGEIYNHQELRRELESLGHRFRSNCDTETVLRAFEQWDVACFRRMRGMFAVALWCEREQRLVLVRDRMGIKPLYYCRRGDDVYFGSELKAILEHPEIPRQIDLKALDAYLSVNYVPGPQTLIQGIRKVPAGHLLEWRKGRMWLESWWKAPSASKRQIPLEEAKEELDWLLHDSVREHLVSDVPLGVWSSGGLDSSTVLHYAATQSGRRLNTFSVSFHGRSFDESRYFREIARVYGTDHHEFDLNPDVERMSDPEVSILHQDCSQPWNVDPESLDAVFTSNFFEHLPTKDALERTLLEARRALKPGGRLVAMGPNIKYLPGVYWDYFDHYLPLTELSLVEILRKCGFEVEFCRGQFLPYTMSAGRQYPIWILRLYLALPPLWRLFGKQFLVVGKRLD